MGWGGVFNGEYKIAGSSWHRFDCLIEFVESLLTTQYTIDPRGGAAE